MCVLRARTISCCATLQLGACHVDFKESYACCVDVVQKQQHRFGMMLAGGLWLLRSCLLAVYTPTPV